MPGEAHATDYEAALRALSYLFNIYYLSVLLSIYGVSLF